MVDRETCGAQHLKLAIWVIGLILTVVSGLAAFGINQFSAYESRLREVEQRTVRIEVVLTNVDTSLARLEKGLSKYWDTQGAPTK